jgi:uncharacterized protein (DUF2267 family)
MLQGIEDDALVTTLATLATIRERIKPQAATAAIGSAA